MSKDKTVEKLKKKTNPILRKYNARFAYLFGSRAKGKGVIKDSDFDIAVFLGVRGAPSLCLDNRLRLMYELQESLAPARVDLVILDDINSVALRQSITAEGILLYEKDRDARVYFEFRTLHEYEEFLPFLEAYNKAYSQAI